MRKTFYYKDELNDDFGTTVKKIVPLPENYRYDSNIFTRLASFILYRFVARPLAWCYMKLKFHHKTVGKRKVSSLKSGCLIYGNHVTLLGDACMSNLLTVKKRNFIITGEQAGSLTALLWLMKTVGNIPQNSRPYGQRAVLRAVKKHIDEGNTVTVFPEGHVWPYYTGIRPYSADSFRYAAILGVPVVSLTTCFVRRRFAKTPKIVSYVDGPFYPKEELNHAENAEYLRDAVYDAMTKRAGEYSTYSYHEYIKATEEEPSSVGSESSAET